MRIVRDQRVAFVIVGVVNTVVGFGWFVLAELTVGRWFGYLASLGVAHILSVIGAFILYRRFVFRVRGHVLRDLARFELVYLVAISVNFVALPLLVEFGGLVPVVAQALIVIVTTLISFVGHRYFSFRRAPGGSDDGSSSASQPAGVR